MYSGGTFQCLESDRFVEERKRIAEVYRRYARDKRYRNKWGPGEGQSQILDRKWEVIRAALNRVDFKAAGARVVDIGAGSANELARLEDLGCSGTSIVFLDLLLERTAAAAQFHPSIPFVVGNAACLPFADEQFDLSYQSVMASSVLSLAMRKAIAREMVRVTRRGGLILWYDVRYRNPFNPETRPISRAQIRVWFSDCEGEIISLTLIPPIARVIAGWSRKACRLLEALPPLRSHLLAVLRRK